MNPDPLPVVLRFIADDAGRVREVAHELRGETRATEAALDDLEARAAAITARLLGAELKRPPTPPRLRPVTDRAPADWDRLLVRAAAVAETEGPSDDMWRIDDLLADGIAERIERLHGTLELRTTLDHGDIAAVVVAGVAGALMDCLVVGAPHTTVWKGVRTVAGPLTVALRRHAVPADNWFADLAYVPFDRVGGVDIVGMSPRTHRVQTFGHDPLLGLVLGTMDIMRGTLTGAHPPGHVTVIQTAQPSPDVVVAIGVELMHLISDVITHMGLPLPGWTALMAIPVGQVGEFDSVAQVARWMYHRGYGTWHFLSMATVPAAVETVIRTYLGLRRLADEDFASMWDVEARRSGAERIVDHPRYRSMSVFAHGIATLGNAGKLAMAGGNPLALNYAEWVMFLRRFAESLQPDSPTEMAIGLANANRLALDAGWVKLGVDPDLDI